MGEAQSATHGETQVNMVYMHPADPLQKNAYEFGMDGKPDGLATTWPRGLYCVQIFKSGSVIASQWPAFDVMHRGLNLTGKPNVSSCAAIGATTQVANPVLADGQVVRGGSWFMRA